MNSALWTETSEFIEKYFEEKKLDLTATLDYKEALKDAKFVIISTPTNYDDEKNFFDIEKYLSHKLKIKSTDTVEVYDCGTVNA